MATREIKTTIELDGEQKFKQALSAATREMRVMESELKAVSAAYDVNGNSAEFFAAKQKNIRDQISQQRQIIEALEQAVEDAAKAYGEGSSQVDGYAIRLNNARTRMSRLEKELEATDREVEELGRDSVKAGRQIEQGIGESAAEAEKDVRGLISTLQDDLNAIRTSTTFTAISSLWDRAKSAYSSAASFVEGTVEYRKQLSFLQQNAETKDFDFSFIKEQLIEVQALASDSSAAVEGLSNLLATDISAEQMVRAVDGLAGAVIKFPDTLKFESLADGLQETLATGSATGQFSELLERLGYDIDEFNSALEKSPTAAGDMEIALAHMAAGGLNDVYTKWRDTNSEMISAQETQAAIELELAEFAGTLERYFVSPAKEAFLNVLKWANDEVDEFEAMRNELASDKTGRSGEVNLFGEGKNTREYYNDPNNYKTWEDVKAAASATPIGPPTLEQWEAAREKELDAFRQARADWFEFNEATPIGPPTLEQYEAAGEKAGEAYINGLETQMDLALWGEGKMAESAEIITINPVEAWEEAIKNEEKNLREAGEEAGEAVEEGFSTSIEGMESSARQTGAAVAAAFGAGLASQVSYVSAASSALAAAAAAGLKAAGAITALRNSASTPMIINLDGRQVGSGLAPYASEFMAVSID